ncbi:MAG: DUF2007 domain-containing protein [Alistipes sp.]|nr:DUF2007 domain-containing protein [Alistipes sp.]
MTTTTDNLVVLRSYDNQMQAEIAKSILDSAGMFCTLRNEMMSMIYPTGIVPVQLMVGRDDLERAAQLLLTGNGRF